MWAELSVARRVQLIVICCLSVVTAGFAVLMRNYFFVLAVLCVPVIALVERWGEYNQERRSAARRMAFGAFAMLLAASTLSLLHVSLSG
jgi:hypothetical protein